MTKSFLILHGLGNHRPPAHWQFWLAGRLVERGHRVSYPDLPSPDEPDLEAWRDVLDAELGRLGGDERVLVCHSLSCLLWFHSSGDISASVRPDRLVLVSPPASAQVPPAGAGFRIGQIDADAVRSSVGGEILVVASDSDPYNPAGAQSTYGDALGLRVLTVPGAGHITPTDGYGPWPMMEKWCRGALSDE